MRLDSVLLGFVACNSFTGICKMKRSIAQAKKKRKGS